ncbi:MAG: sigma-70 family RNA polymerase sigma factor [Planctomycetota bacterium]
MRLQDRTSTWNSRDHFLAVAATAMRNLVIDHARRRRSRELHDEPGGAMEVLLSAYDEPDVDLLALHEALDELAQFDAQAARLVELRYFVGASAEEAAEAAGLSARTATRRHEFAKRWLRKRLGGDADE